MHKRITYLIKLEGRYYIVESVPRFLADDVYEAVGEGEYKVAAILDGDCRCVDCEKLRDKMMTDDLQCMKDDPEVVLPVWTGAYGRLDRGFTELYKRYSDAKQALMSLHKCRGTDNPCEYPSEKQLSNFMKAYRAAGGQVNE